MKTYREEASRQLIGEQAAQWLCDLRGENGNDADRHALLTWLKQSPRHVEEFLLATSVWKAFDQADPPSDAAIEQAIAAAKASSDAETVVALTAGTAVRRPRRWPRRWPWRWPWRWRRSGWAAAAVLIAACALAWWLPGGEEATAYTTATGEQRAVRLADGSVLYLNTASRVEVHYSEHERRLDLLAGEALFVVAQQPKRPFRVAAGPATIEALGTQFNVRRHASNTRIFVLEGRIRVSADAGEGFTDETKAQPRGVQPEQTLAAGEEAQVDGDGQITTANNAESTVATAWRERRLVFRGDTLRDIAAEFNRYNLRKIVVAGELAGSKRLAGTFNADDPAALVLFLGKYDDLSVESTAEAFIVRDRQRL